MAPTSSRVHGQVPPSVATPPTTAAGTSAVVPGTPTATSPDATMKRPFKPEELEQMLAAIALYPDPLLTQMLMASTYPLEVVQADRWVKSNPTVAGDALAKALESQVWDPSVKSLVNFPQILA